MTPDPVEGRTDAPVQEAVDWDVTCDDADPDAEWVEFGCATAVTDNEGRGQPQDLSFVRFGGGP